MAERSRRRVWRYNQRVAYALIAAALAVTIVGLTIGGLRLHHAVLIEHKSLRTQQLGQDLLKLQGIALQVEPVHGVTPQIAARRRSARAATEADFAAMKTHDATEASRLEAAYTAYMRTTASAFAVAKAQSGAVPPGLQRMVQHRILRLETLIGAEASRQAADIRRVNPSARFALILGAAAAGLAILLLAALFEHERRSGRIDRDHAARAEELVRVRDEFVAVVSHELRTPLTSIIGYLELIADDGTENMSSEQIAHLEVVRRSTERLGELVGDLLLVAEAGRAPLSLDMSELDVGVVAEHAVLAARPAADARGIELLLERGSDGTMRGDPTRLSQMLDNLVSNAIKFTPKGGRVTVRVECREGDTLFAVRDTGRGIPPSERERLFEPFYRAGDAARRAVPGTGLGLTIAKAIVDAHGGTIEVESGLRGGTTFRVRIPLVRPGPVPAAAPA